MTDSAMTHGDYCIANPVANEVARFCPPRALNRTFICVVVQSSSDCRTQTQPSLRTGIRFASTDRGGNFVESKS